MEVARTQDNVVLTTTFFPFPSSEMNDLNKKNCHHVEISTEIKIDDIQVTKHSKKQNKNH